MSAGSVNVARSVQERSQPSTVAPPSHGVFSVLLHVLIMAVTANTVAKVDDFDRWSVLIPLAAGGGLLGYVLSRTPALDAISHLLALVLGGAATVSLAAISADGWSSTWNERGRNVWELSDRVGTTLVTGGARTLPDADLLVLIGFTLFLVGYSSAWMLYRRHWVMPAITLPGVMIMVSLRFKESAPAAPLAAFGIASLLIAARNYALIRQLEWSRSRVPVPNGFAAKVTTGAAGIAVVALLAGSFLPFRAPDSVLNLVSDQVNQSWTWAQRTWADLGGPTVNAPRGAADYSEFAESFSIDGEFVETESLIATVDIEIPTYLTVRSYNVYDGGNWSSDVDATFRLPGDRSDLAATTVTFEGGQPVALSPELSGDRGTRAAIIEVYDRQDGLIFTIDAFSSTTMRSVAILGWQQLPEQAIEVDSVDIGSLPIDLQALVRFIRGTEFAADEETGEPTPVESESAARLGAERVRLQSYPVDTSLQFANDGGIILVVSGRVPNYDDIEAVFVNEPTDGDFEYRVTGQQSLASEEALRGAGTDYPSWVTSRYLQRSPAITQRTDVLTQQIVDDFGATNPFDKALVIQQYLRSTFRYELNPQPGPEDQDEVDYFLFDGKTGRCTHYASAMVVMLRSQGVPARIVSGFRDSDERTPSGSLVFRGKQAHTWVEAFFPGYGWIPFEPTASEDTFEYGEGEFEPAPLPTAEPPVAEATPEPTVEPTVEATPIAEQPPVVTRSNDTSWTDRLSGGLGMVALGLTALAAAVVLGLIGIWAWGLRGMRPGAALYAKTIRIGRLWGVEPDASMTPGEYALQFGEAVPPARSAARIVADIYTAERYGGVEISEDAHRTGEQAWHSVRRALVGWRPWRRSRFR